MPTSVADQRERLPFRPAWRAIHRRYRNTAFHQGIEGTKDGGGIQVEILEIQQFEDLLSVHWIRRMNGQTGRKLIIKIPPAVYLDRRDLNPEVRIILKDYR
jgi:hypothetical protein